MQRMGKPAQASQTTRIPPKRFSAHVLLSAVAASIPHLLHLLAIRISLSYFPRTHLFPTHLSILQPIIFLFTLNLTNVLGLALRPFSLGQGTRSSLRSESYRSGVSAIVATLHVATLLLARHVTGGFTPRQHAAVHFCLVFWVLEECDAFWAYMQWREARRAGGLPRFEHLREPAAYRAGAPDFSWYGGLSKECLVGLAECVVFHVVCGAAAYAMKSVVNPDPGCGILCGMVGGVVLFGGYPASMWEAVLGLALLRVVRQASYMAFWAVFALARRWG